MDYALAQPWVIVMSSKSSKDFSAHKTFHFLSIYFFNPKRDLTCLEVNVRLLSASSSPRVTAVINRVASCS